MYCKVTKNICIYDIFFLILQKIKNINQMTISLIISTYNSPKALNLCLESIKRQVRKPDEIIIADDGSTDETKIIINYYSQLFSIPMKHVWHEDRGFRLAEIRNKAIKFCSCDYIIQIDGDIVMSSRFIADHEMHAEEGYFCTGSRAMVSKRLTAEAMDTGHFVPTPYTPGVHAKENAVRIPWLTHLFFNKNKVNGCNMAFWRKDVFTINGYDQDIVGWGAEDHDFAERLQRAGIKHRHLKFCAVQYHLYHPSNSKNALQQHKLLLEENRKNNTVRCKNGIEQLTDC